MPAVLGNRAQNSKTRICVVVCRHHSAIETVAMFDATRSKIAASYAPADAGAHRAPLRAPAGRRRRGRIRPGRGAVSGADLRDHGNRDGVLRRPDAGNRRRRQRAPDHDRPGADRRASTRPSSRRGLRAASTDCSTARTASMSTSRLYAASPRSTPPRRSTPTAICNTDDFGYQPGGPGDIVVVRSDYQWPVYVSLLGLNLSDMSAAASAADGDRRVPQRTVPVRRP